MRTMMLRRKEESNDRRAGSTVTICLSRFRKSSYCMGILRRTCKTHGNTEAITTRLSAERVNQRTLEEVIGLPLSRHIIYIHFAEEAHIMNGAFLSQP